MTEVRTILVVEDEEMLAKAACLGLKKRGYQTYRVKTAEEAENILFSDKRIDAIWLDHYLLAGATGLDLLYNIRKDTRFDKLPIFVVTNSVGEDKVASYKLLNIEKYYVKAETKLSDIVQQIDNTFGGTR